MWRAETRTNRGRKRRDLEKMNSDAGQRKVNVTVVASAGFGNLNVMRSARGNKG